MANVVVTGANRGIGLELVKLFTGRGDRVFAACRSSSDELAATGATVVTGVDVASSDGVKPLAAALADATVDVLVNNAGILTAESLEDPDFARMARQFEINSLGPLRVTTALLPRLEQGSKVAIITSRMGSIADNTSGGMYGYRMSKAAVNAAGVSLARDLASRGIAVTILHPGFVRTGMTGGRGNVEPAEAAAQLLARIDEASVERTGEFRHANGDALPW